MAATLGPVPVFLRVGDGEECEIGTITPELGDVERDEGGSLFVSVTASIGQSLPGLLRAAADGLEKASA